MYKTLLYGYTVNTILYTYINDMLFNIDPY